MKWILPHCMIRYIKVSAVFIFTIGCTFIVVFIILMLACYHCVSINCFVSLSNVICPCFFQINKADFSCPSWFPVGAKSLIHRILDPNPETVSSLCAMMLVTVYDLHYVAFFYIICLVCICAAYLY